MKALHEARNALMADLFGNRFERKTLLPNRFYVYLTIP